MWRRIWITVAIVVGAVVAAPFVLTIPLPTGDLQDVAARFQPEGYVSASEPSIEPRRILCLGDNPCPSMSRHWTFEEPVPVEDLQRWLDAAGFDLQREGDCDNRGCWASGVVDGWSVTTQSSPATAGLTGWRVVIWVRPQSSS